MSILSSLKISGSGLTAQRLRMDVIANNIANAETVQTDQGGPYQRQEVVFTPIKAATNSTRAVNGRRGPSNPEEGVQVAAVLRDETPPKMVYDPENPLSDADGYTAYPDIDIVTEMTDMISATRAYEANVTAINAAKSMAAKALDIGRG